MLVIAICIFGFGAFGGIVLASHIARDQFPPWTLSIGHALLGVTGLSLLSYLVIEAPASQGQRTAMLALMLFFLAALGGITLATFHARGKRPPMAAVLTHALIAVSAFLILVSIVLFQL